MVAKGGTTLLQDRARAALIERLLPLAALITPNAPEAAALTGLRVESVDDMERAADHLLALGASAVLVKGGHLPGDTIVDLLRTADGEAARFEHARIATRSTHGTGCTLSAAIACGVAHGFTLRNAVERAEDFVVEAIRTAPGLGRGHGPLNHGHVLGARLN
jgi:hydroxymethylpyrimidine/phosphomethylpyrimidine kinase